MKQCGQAEAEENGGCWREAGDRGEVWTAGEEGTGKAQWRDAGKTGAARVRRAGGREKKKKRNSSPDCGEGPGEVR